jgi:predicted lipoprotein with Yx(FWY)xxD motif
MRTIARALSFCALLFLAAGAAKAASKAPDKEEHPADVALIEDSGNWAYRHFPSNLRLYIFDKDTPKSSACTDTDGCAGVWPPLLASDEAKPMGDWTVITRGDTRKQWAYKGHPVYLRYHDSPDAPTGNGVDGVWHFLEP